MKPETDGKEGDDMPQTKERRERYKIVSVELPIEFYREFERAARRESITKSDVVRTALRSYLKR